MTYEARFKDGPLKGEKMPMGRSLPSDLAVMVEGGKAYWYHDDVEAAMTEDIDSGDVALYELGEVDGDKQVGEYHSIEFVPTVERRRVT
jgi:hypothetical protein